jgi:hypothetical protein
VTRNDGEVLLAAYLRELATGRRSIRVVEKATLWHQHVADVFLRVVTLGGQSRYLTDYITTLGHTIYVPSGWEKMSALHRYTILRHEVVHVRQFERYTWPGMVLIYGLFPLPIGLAYGRARLEWEAYAETLRATAEAYGYEAACDPGLHDDIVARFVGPDYVWMWPFPNMVRRWIAECLAELRDVNST